MSATLTSLALRAIRSAFLTRNDSRHSGPVAHRIAGRRAPLPAALRRSVTTGRGTGPTAHGSRPPGAAIDADAYFCDPAVFQL